MGQGRCCRELLERRGTQGTGRTRGTGKLAWPDFMDAQEQPRRPAASTGTGSASGPGCVGPLPAGDLPEVEVVGESRVPGSPPPAPHSCRRLLTQPDHGALRPTAHGSTRSRMFPTDARCLQIGGGPNSDFPHLSETVTLTLRPPVTAAGRWGCPSAGQLATVPTAPCV